MSEPVVLVDKQDGIATVTLNRPEKLNALNRELRLAFCHAMQALRTDPEVRVVIITGAGRAFCVGLDLRELGTKASGIRDEGNATFITVIDDMEVPVIGAINGFAITGGFEIALACDIMIAAEEAQFADTHARVGVMPGGGMSARLPRAVGIRKAKELSLTGNYLSAPEAERMGLVNRVVPRDQLMSVAREMASQITGANQTIVRSMKQLYVRTTGATLDEALRIEQDAFNEFNRKANLADLANAGDSVIARGRTQASKS
ncbi:MAG TPA: enoyl-CoA hydratase [Candidatus Binataceae bacterium]|nr:enoyl-CoA hydratase [Candidatus Binataceae bacterium]